MRIEQGSDNGGRGTMERRAAEAANAALVLAYYHPKTSAALAIGTTTTKVTLGANVTYIVNGAIATKNSAADVWTLSGTTVQAGSVQRYLLCLDFSGNPAVFEATQALGTAGFNLTWSNVNGKGQWRPLLYVTSQGYTPVGSVQIVTDATHTFIPGTTALSATGITATYTNGLDSSFVPLIGDLSGRSVGSY